MFYFREDFARSFSTGRRHALSRHHAPKTTVDVAVPSRKKQFQCDREPLQNGAMAHERVMLSIFELDGALWLALGVVTSIPG